MTELLIEELHAPLPYARDLLIERGIGGINCGSGKELAPGYVNVDQLTLTDTRGKASEPGKLMCVTYEGQILYYMQHDMTQAFPFVDKSFSWGYSEHFIEHVPLEHAIAWLTEMRRLIAPGGLLRITTPDLKKYMNGYADPEERFFRLHNVKLADMTTNGEPLPRRRAWMVNQIFRYFGHQWIYDIDEIVHAASAAGFDPARIAQKEYQSGTLEAVFMMDSPLREDETLYVEILT